MIGSEKFAAGNDVEVRDLHKRFSDAYVLRGVSLSVKRGESVALLGSNGSGKSTLLRSTMRLIEPDSGSIRLLGHEILSLRGRELRKLRAQVGFIFQKHNLVPRLSALSNVIHGVQGQAFGPGTWYQSLAPQARRIKAMECLDLVGLSHIAMRRVDKLSGGQSQRVAIARALMQEPKAIFADEPVASLDPVAGTEVMELLASLAKEKGITLLFTTHHLEHALEYSDRILGLSSGEMELNAQASDVTLEQLREFYSPPSAEPLQEAV